MSERGDDKMSVLHVMVRAGATSSQYNEHCLPVREERRISVCSLLPAEVAPPPDLVLYEGDGSRRGCWRALRTALEMGPHDVVHVHAPASGVLTLAAYIRLRLSRDNLVFTVHNSWRNFRPRNRLFLYLIMLLFPTVVVCGAAARDSMPKLVRAFRKNLPVVPNGVDVARIDRVLATLVDDKSADDSLVVVSVGRLIPIKRPGTVLQAFLKAKGARAGLVFIGDGPLRSKLEDAVVRAGLDRRVSFTGVIERDQVYPLLSLADVFISASAGEGLPVAVLEAMACRTPVILSDIPPHREIVRVAPTVPLVRVGDVDGFARALDRLLAMEPKERRELGESQRASVVDHFSVRAMNQAYGEIYRAVLNSRGIDEDGDPPPTGSQSRPIPADAGFISPDLLRWKFVAVLAVLGALAGGAYAQVRPPEYHANATLIVGDVIGGPADESGLKASAALAASYADLVRRQPVLQPVAERGFAEKWRSLQKRVYAATGDKSPQLVQITASAESAGQAESLANAVAQQLVALAQAGNTEDDPMQRFAEQQVSRLESEIVAIQQRIQEVQDRLDAEPPPTNADDLRAEQSDLHGSLVDLEVAYQDALDRVTPVEKDGRVTILEQGYAGPDPLRPDLIGLLGAGTALGLILAAAWIYLGRRRDPGRGEAADVRATTIASTPHWTQRGPFLVRPDQWAPPGPANETQPPIWWKGQGS